MKGGAGRGRGKIAEPPLVAIIQRCLLLDRPEGGRDDRSEAVDVSYSIEPLSPRDEFGMEITERRHRSARRD